uniref:Non-specific lipid-transfer protein n=1 Tax=Sorghum bicolor TaxID=4558 RepID=Q8W0R7_SORBI|nr:putative lipid transfer protein [Sorghum bicolor]
MKKGGAGIMVAVAVALVVLVAAASSSVARADVSCADVDANLRACVGYVTGKEAAPGGECCAGVRRIRGMPSGTAERRQACECVKQAAAGYQPLNADAIRDLPKQCGAPLPFPLTLNFDCTTRKRTHKHLRRSEKKIEKKKKERPKAPEAIRHNLTT